MRPLFGKVEFVVGIDRPLMVWQEENQNSEDLLNTEAEAMRTALEKYLATFPFEDTVAGGSYSCWVSIKQNSLETIS